MTVSDIDNEIEHKTRELKALEEKRKHLKLTEPSDCEIIEWDGGMNKGGERATIKLLQYGFGTRETRTYKNVEFVADGTELVDTVVAWCEPNLDAVKREIDRIKSALDEAYKIYAAEQESES